MTAAQYMASQDEIFDSIKAEHPEVDDATINEFMDICEADDNDEPACADSFGFWLICRIL